MSRRNEAVEMRFLESIMAGRGVTHPGHVKTWGRAGLKPEGAIAKEALATKPNKSPIESHTRTPFSSRPIKSKTAFVSTLVLIISTGASNQAHEPACSSTHPRNVWRPQSVMVQELPQSSVR